MKTQEKTTDMRIKRNHLGVKGFLITYLTVLLLAGIQTGIIVSPIFASFNDFWKINTIIIYWAVVAFIFVYITSVQIREQYEKPMRVLSEATREVARGDFSIYIEPMNTADRYDYIDVMFLDFNVMVKELGSIETLKNDFVSNVSHEIKTPLAIIKNYTAALKKDNLPKATRDEYIDIVSSATDKLSNLVTNILRLNKLENQDITTVTEEFDLCRQLSECVLNFESLWDEKEINLTVDIEDRAIIKADQELLEIVWNNLLSNAIKYTNKGGKVSLIQESETDLISVKVIDSGRGMDESTMQRIFDKFYQADTSRNNEGNGLGLTLAYRIIEKIGGSISVSSKLDEGSTFTVKIPVNN